MTAEREVPHAHTFTRTHMQHNDKHRHIDNSTGVWESSALGRASHNLRESALGCSIKGANRKADARTHTNHRQMSTSICKLPHTQTYT